MVATDASGNVVWKESYRPYGERLTNETGSNSNNQLWFAGKPYDAVTGLSYMGARYYEPVLGRFMGVDPVDFQPSNIHSFNRYTYANNNPYKFIDPDGKSATLIIQGAALGAEGGFFVCGPACAAIGAIGGGFAIAYLGDKALTWALSSSAVSPDAGKAGSSTGCIYLCDGVTVGQRTPSGRPYVGSADDLDARAKGARDGRERDGATVIDEYKKGDRNGRRNTEQKGINDQGGKGELDNKRDEVAGKNWGDRGIKPPKEKE